MHSCLKAWMWLSGTWSLISRVLCQSTTQMALCFLPFSKGFAATSLALGGFLDAGFKHTPFGSFSKDPDAGSAESALLSFSKDFAAGCAEPPLQSFSKDFFGALGSFSKSSSCSCFVFCPFFQRAFLQKQFLLAMLGPPSPSDCAVSLSQS